MGKEKNPFYVTAPSEGLPHHRLRVGAWRLSVHLDRPVVVVLPKGERITTRPDIPADNIASDIITMIENALFLSSDYRLRNERTKRYTTLLNTAAAQRTAVAAVIEGSFLDLTSGHTMDTILSKGSSNVNPALASLCAYFGVSPSLSQENSTCLSEEENNLIQYTIRDLSTTWRMFDKEMTKGSVRMLAQSWFNNSLFVKHTEFAEAAREDLYKELTVLGNEYASFLDQRSTALNNLVVSLRRSLGRHPSVASLLRFTDKGVFLPSDVRLVLKYDGNNDVFHSEDGAFRFERHLDEDVLACVSGGDELVNLLARDADVRRCKDSIARAEARLEQLSQEEKRMPEIHLVDVAHSGPTALRAYHDYTYEFFCEKPGCFSKADYALRLFLDKSLAGSDYTVSGSLHVTRGETSYINVIVTP